VTCSNFGQVTKTQGKICNGEILTAPQKLYCSWQRWQTSFLGQHHPGRRRSSWGLTSSKTSHPAAVLAQKCIGAVGGACILTLVGALVALELVDVLGVGSGDEHEECHEGKRKLRSFMLLVMKVLKWWLLVGVIEIADGHRWWRDRCGRRRKERCNPGGMCVYMILGREEMELERPGQERRFEVVSSASTGLSHLVVISRLYCSR
jgi:hypothetical protein